MTRFLRGHKTFPPALFKEVKAETLAFLDRRIACHRHLRRQCLEEEKHEEQSRRAAALLPSDAVIDKILRYETGLERQIHRAVTQLERLQRMRRGESIPAPLSVDLSDRW